MKLFYYFAFLPIAFAFPNLRHLQIDEMSGCVIDRGHIDCIINKPYGPPPQGGTITDECPEHCQRVPDRFIELQKTENEDKTEGEDDDDNENVDISTYETTNCYMRRGHINCEIIN